MKHSSFATTVPGSSNAWEDSSIDALRMPPRSPQAQIETLDAEGSAAFASIHQKARAMDEDSLMRLFLGEN